MRDYSNSEINQYLREDIDALLIVSTAEDAYRSIKCSGSISKLIAEQGSYKELIEKLWFHINGSNTKISDEYQVFLPKMGEFKGRTAQKGYFEIDGAKHAVQMLVFPIPQNEGDYIIVICDLGEEEIAREASTESKVKTIQKTYLFSMYVDLNKDSTGSINVSEISGDDMHYEVKYSDWRLMIVNMIWPDDQATFLEMTSPEYLRTHLKPAGTLTYDCQMKNLEGDYIWVKLIFGRSGTTSETDFRFVFMVENIHESSMQLFNELKKFENLASHDALTGVFNRGRIETELSNAIDALKSGKKTVSLMMIDIDYFKTVNDSFGHAVGDEVLKTFVAKICAKLQDYDIKIGRWGGEEFVCVCYDLSLDFLVDFANKLRMSIAAEPQDTVGFITCSIGLANVSAEDTPKEAFDRVDNALYDAKTSGRNCVKTRASS